MGNNGNSNRFFFFFLVGVGTKITADGDCSQEIERCLILGRKVITNLDSISKNRDLTLPTKVHLVKAVVFPVAMHGCDSWTIKKAECRRIDAFELWCWRRLLRVPWTARRPNQSTLKEIIPECSLGRLILKMKLQYFGHLMEGLTHLKKPWCWERLKVGGEGDDRIRCLDGITDSMVMSLSKFRELLMDREALVLQSMVSQRVWHVEWLNWTEDKHFLKKNTFVSSRFEKS